MVWRCRRPHAHEKQRFKERLFHRPHVAADSGAGDSADGGRNRPAALQHRRSHLPGPSLQREQPGADRRGAGLPYCFHHRRFHQPLRDRRRAAVRHRARRGPAGKGQPHRKHGVRAAGGDIAGADAAVLCLHASADVPVRRGRSLLALCRRLPARLSAWHALHHARDGHERIHQRTGLSARGHGHDPGRRGAESGARSAVHIHLSSRHRRRGVGHRDQPGGVLRMGAVVSRRQTRAPAAAARSHGATASAA